ncbi:MAG: sensor histidine kinase [Planctomycetota bacterium]
MKRTPPLEPSRALQLLFVATALGVSTRALITFAAWDARYLALVACLAAYCVLGLGVWSGRFGYLRYLFVQNVLALVLIGLARFVGPIEILMMPLAAQGSLALSMRPALAMAAAMSAATQFPVWALYGFQIDSSLLVGHSSGIVFVVVFTQILKQEIDRRVAAERSRRDAELATQAERNRLAREIHDGLGHHLSVLAVQLEGARHLVDDDPARASEVLERCRDLARDALSEVRGSVAAMRSERALDRPLEEALEELAETGRAAGLDVSVSWTGVPEGLGAAQVLTIYRAAQEGLTNAIKHGRSIRRVEIRVTMSPARVEVDVLDDGEALARGDGPAEGFGLAGLRERAQLLGGSLVARALEPRGFALRLEFPRT